MKIAVTGGTGHLGYVLHKKLTKLDIDHRLLLRKKVDFIDHNDIAIGALGESNPLRVFLKDCSVLVHCAGLVWPKKGKNIEVHNVNFEFSKRLFGFAKEAGVKHFVYISSIHSMNPPKHDLVFDEAASLQQNPAIAYDFSKAEMERFLNQQDEMKITIINPTAVIGPGDRYVRGMNQLFERVLNNDLPMITAGGFNVVDVRTVSDAIIQAILKQAYGKFLIGNKYMKMTEIAKQYGAINNLKVTNKVLGERAMKLLATMLTPFERFSKKPFPINSYAVETLLEGHQNISSEKAYNTLELDETPLEKTLRDLHAWFTENKLII